MFLRNGVQVETVLVTERKASACPLSSALQVGDAGVQHVFAPCVCTRKSGSAQWLSPEGAGVSPAGGLASTRIVTVAHVPLRVRAQAAGLGLIRVSQTMVIVSQEHAHVLRWPWRS